MTELYTKKVLLAKTWKISKIFSKI